MRLYVFLNTLFHLLSSPAAAERLAAANEKEKRSVHRLFTAPFLYVALFSREPAQIIVIVVVVIIIVILDMALHNGLLNWLEQLTVLPAS